MDSVWTTLVVINFGDEVDKAKEDVFITLELTIGVRLSSFEQVYSLLYVFRWKLDGCT